MTNDNRIVLGLLRDAQKTGVNISSSKRRALPPDVAALAHRQAKILNDTEKRTDAIKRVNAQRSKTKNRKISNSLVEAQSKEKQDRLEVAAQQLTQADLEAAAAVLEGQETLTETEVSQPTPARRGRKSTKEST